MAMSARQAALRAIAAFRKNGAWSEQFLKNLLEKENMPPREAALATRLCFGVLQNMALIDHYIFRYSTVKQNKMEPMVLDILRISVYQIVFMQRIPERAAVSEGVELVKKYANTRAAGLANAILRKITLEADKLPPVPRNEQYLSTRYSHPEWLVKQMIADYGAAETEKLLEANNSQTPLFARVNTLKTDAVRIMEMLGGGKLSAQPHPWLPDYLILEKTGNLEALPSFSEGLFYIQDPAAGLAVMAAGLVEGQTVLDACAAPGGKSFSAAIQMKNDGKILSCDIHEKKLSLIRQGAKRLGILIIRTSAMDGREPEESFLKGFDTVIADVPCSGMGVIRKKPDIRYKKPEELENLPRVQLALLRNLSSYVKPGGVLLYTTCTILKRENEGVIEAFLEKQPEFYPEAFTLPEPVGKVGTGMTTLMPHIHGTDGFFICKLRRRNHED